MASFPFHRFKKGREEESFFGIHGISFPSSFEGEKEQEIVVERWSLH